MDLRLKRWFGTGPDIWMNLQKNYELRLVAPELGEGWKKSLGIMTKPRRRDLGNDIMVSESDKLLVRILRGTSDTNISFEGMCRLLRNLGFEGRTRGSHHIFTKDGVEEILNLQSKAGRAKPY